MKINDTCEHGVSKAELCRLCGAAASPAAPQKDAPRANSSEAALPAAAETVGERAEQRYREGVEDAAKIAESRANDKGVFGDIGSDTASQATATVIATNIRALLNSNEWRKDLNDTLDATRTAAIKECVEKVKTLPDHSPLCDVWIQLVCNCSFRLEAAGALESLLNEKEKKNG